MAPVQDSTTFCTLRGMDQGIQVHKPHPAPMPGEPRASFGRADRILAGTVRPKHPGKKNGVEGPRSCWWG